MEEEKKWACERLNLKEIPDFPGYFCNEEGKVYSTLKCGPKAKPGIKEKKSRFNHNGYLSVMLSQNKKSKTLFVHRLKRQQYKPTFFSHMMRCNHINGIKADNRISNLEWVTCLQNSQHMVNVLGKSSRCENHHKAKVKNEDIKTIKSLHKEGMSQKDIAIKFSLSHSNVNAIIKGRIWRHLE